MRDLINKMILLESGVNDLPKIGLNLKRLGGHILFGINGGGFHPETLNVDKKLIIKKESGEKTVDIKFIRVRFNLYMSFSQTGDLVYLTDRGTSIGHMDISTQPTLKFLDLAYVHNSVLDIADKISQLIGFEKNILKIRPDSTIIDTYGSILAPIDFDFTEDVLKIFNAAYKWRQDTVGDL